MYRLSIGFHQKLFQIHIHANGQDFARLRSFLIEHNFHISESPVFQLEQLPHLVIPQVNDCSEFPLNEKTPWFVWNLRGSEEIALKALEHGALCVLPQDLSVNALAQALEHTHEVFSQRFHSHNPSHLTKRHFDLGSKFHLDHDRVAVINRGIVRCTSVHADGSEVLVGFYGPNDVLLSHASHQVCHVEMRAHTSLMLTLEPWSVAVTKADFHEKMKRRICQMEQWSSIQARANAEKRLLGMLYHLAEKFSRDEKGYIILDLKMTHEHISAAIGVTRTTATRLISNLKKKGELSVIRTEMGERIALKKGKPDSFQAI